MNLNKKGFRIIPIFSAFFLLLFFVNPTNAATPSMPKPTSAPRLHTFSVNPAVSLLDSSFSPNLVGGAPFCPSGGLGTILCYPPNFMKKAYNFPSGLDGTGQTIVIVDAFGSPTAQSDLDTYDNAFGVPPGTVTVLCGPTWTGSASDNCPVKTVSDLFTPPPPGSNADQCGGVPGMVGWAEETTLDITMAHALAPSAHIVLVVSDDCFDSSINTAEMAVVSQSKYKGSVMSQSFGSPDDLVTCTTLDPTGTFCIARDPSLLDAPNAIFKLAAHNRWTVIASSGDDGANTDARVLGTGELTPSFPATSPLVMAAGGTQGSPYGGQFGGPPGRGRTFTCAAGATCNTGLVIINGGANGCGTPATRPGEPTSCFPTGYGGESAWNEFSTFGLGTSSGGGISMLYSRPSYQQFLPGTVTTLSGATLTIGGRTTPDVSFNSAIYGGALAFLGFLGRWGVFGGTSAASPAWAGIIAMVNQANGSPIGFVNPAIYNIFNQNNQGNSNVNNLPNAFHDITKGNNADCLGQCGEDGFLSGPGYDLTTGWGTPNVSVLISALTGNN